MATSALLVLLALGLATAQAISDFEAFKAVFKKTYSSVEEEAHRRKIFEENLHFVKKHNSMNLSFTVAMNKFGDLTGREFAEIYLSRMPHRNLTYSRSTFLEPFNVDLPTEVDWKKKGYVTGVKNQGECGSCWAFSTTGSMEGQVFRKTGKLISLSEEELVACSSAYGNNGCNGGLMDNAFKYMEKYGAEPEADYPYVSRSGRVPSCRYKSRDVVARTSGFVDIPSGNEGKLTAAIATVGPISVAIDASQASFQLYHDGVYVSDGCSSENLDHGVLAVGYGTSSSDQDYYIVKNSWGPDWGENGYILMARNRHNQCGIATMASYPLVKS